MIKPSERNRERMARPATDWKDSRFVVAALSVAGTATFMATVVMPLTTSALTAKVEALTAKIESMSPEAEKIAGLQTDLEKAKKQHAVAESELFIMREGSPLASDSPYPSGIDKVRLGAPFDLIRRTYASDQISKDPDSDYVSVKVKHPIFSQVTYYPDSKGRISMLLFHMDYRSKVTPDQLREILRARYGTPASEKRIVATWVVQKTEVVLLGNTYKIDSIL